MQEINDTTSVTSVPVPESPTSDTRHLAPETTPTPDTRNLTPDTTETWQQTPEAQKLLRALIAELLEANLELNLTSIRDPEEAWIKHIGDSLKALQLGLFDAPARLVDIGTGAGFPGFPLLIARPQLKMTLLESTGKKCSYMKNVAAKLGLKVSVLSDRAERAGQSPVYRGRYHLATVRAVGKVSEVCELALPLLVIGGHAILWRGSTAEADQKAAAKAVKMLGGEFVNRVKYRLPGHDMDYHLLVVRKTRPTPDMYPRRDGVPKSMPL